MYNISNLKYEKCVGCMSCKNICPKKCISIVKNELGFEYPIIDKKKCINCGACYNVCPVLNFNINKCEFEKVYAAICKDIDIWKKSSSGGAFSTICKKYSELYPNTTIYGAAYVNSESRVKHIGVKYNSIYKIQKSKYVQSSIDDVFSEIYSKLKNGEHVIFSGTPCQNYAIKMFLLKKNIRTDNILLIDFICHGVGSPNTFKDSINKILHDNRISNSDVISINHRGKNTNFFNVNSYNTEIITNDGKLCIKKEKDLHIDLYSQKLNCRDSCEECIYANRDRCSDFTISDFKNFYYEYPKIKGNKNASTIIIHTKKGIDIFDKIKDLFFLYESSIDVVKENNPLYFKFIKCSNQEKRNNFIADYRNSDRNNNIACIKQYRIKKRIINRIKGMIPIKFKERFKYFIKK